MSGERPASDGDDLDYDEDDVLGGNLAQTAAAAAAAREREDGETDGDEEEDGDAPTMSNVAAADASANVEPWQLAQQLQASLLEEQRVRQQTAASAMRIEVTSSAPHPPKLKQPNPPKRSTAATGGGTSVPSSSAPQPSSSGAAAFDLSTKSNRARKKERRQQWWQDRQDAGKVAGRLSSKAPGPAAVAQAAINHPPGTRPVSETGVIYYPYETTYSSEPLSADTTQHLSFDERAARLVRDHVQSAAFSGPIEEQLPVSLCPLGFGGDKKPEKEYDFCERKDFDVSDEAEKRGHEAVEFAIRRDQILGTAPADTVVVGEPYPEPHAQQLPSVAVTLFGEGLAAHQAFTTITANRGGLWDNLSEVDIANILATTGISGSLAPANTFFLRAVIVHATSTRIQFGVFGRDAIQRLRRGIGLTKEEADRLDDVLLITERVQGELLNSIIVNCATRLSYKPSSWNQCALVGSMVALKVRTEPPAQSDMGPGGLGRRWSVFAMNYTKFNPEKDEVSGEDKLLISALPDMNLIVYAVCTLLRSKADLEAGVPSASYDVALHMGMREGGPVGAYISQLVDPSATPTEPYDLTKNNVPDLSALVDGCIVACIGVSLHSELIQRGLPTPMALPQVVRFCVVPSEEVHRLLHGQPEFFESLTVASQFELLRHIQSTQLAVTHYHRHLDRVHGAKCRAVGEILQWDMKQVHPLLHLSLPVVLPTRLEDDEELGAMAARNASMPLKEGDLVRVLTATKICSSAMRSADNQLRLLVGDGLAWEHGFVGRCMRVSPSVERGDHVYTTRAVEIQLSASDRTRLKQVKMRSKVVLEPLPVEWLTELHFIALGSALHMAYVFMGIHGYSDLSREPALQSAFPRMNDLWRPPPRTPREGLAFDLTSPPGRTCGPGALARDAIGIQQDHYELVPVRPDMQLKEVASLVRHNGDFPQFLVMTMLPDSPDRPPVVISPTHQQSTIAMQLNAMRPHVLAVHGAACTGKTTTALMCAQHFVRQGRTPFLLGDLPPEGQRRVLVVCPDDASADVFARLAERLVCQIRKPGCDEAVDQYQAVPARLCFDTSDRESPLRVLRFEGGKPLSHWDTVGDVQGDSVAHMRLSAHMRNPVKVDIDPASLNQPPDPMEQQMFEMHADYVRMKGVEFGSQVDEMTFPVEQTVRQMLCDSYNSAHSYWTAMLAAINKGLAEAPDAGQLLSLSEAFQLERANFYVALHALLYFNPNMVVTTIHDVRSPLLRALGHFEQVFVDDAQQIPFGQMMALLGMITQSPWSSPRTQLVLFGDEQGRLPSTLAKGDACAARRASLFTNILRSTRSPCLTDRPHARLAHVQLLTQRFGLSDDIAAWTQLRTVGRVLPPADIRASTEAAPAFIELLGVTPPSRACRMIELIDMQTAVPDVHHPLYGAINTVEFVYLLASYEVLIRDTTYNPRRVMIVTSTPELAHTLRQFVARGGTAQASFPPVRSFDEANGHTADLVIIAATKIPDAKLRMRASRGDAPAIEALADYVGWLGHSRSLLDVLQRARYKVVILTHMATMSLLSTDLWRDLQRNCVNSGSYGSADYGVLEVRGKCSGMLEMARKLAKTLSDFVEYTRSPDQKREESTAKNLVGTEVRSPVHPLLRHSMWTAEDCLLSAEARHLRASRPGWSRCLNARAQFTAGKVTYPTGAMNVALKPLERSDGVLVNHGIDSPFFTLSAPENRADAHPGQARPKIEPTVVAPVRLARRTADIALAAAGASTPAGSAAQSDTATPSVEMHDATEADRRAQLSRARHAYVMSSGLEEADDVTTPISASSLTTPSSGNTNLSSLGSDARSIGPRGSFLGTSEREGVAQLTHRVSRPSQRPADRGGRAGATAVRSPEYKRPKLTSSSSWEAVEETGFPGVALAQTAMMPPPASTDRQTRPISAGSGGRHSPLRGYPTTGEHRRAEYQQQQQRPADSRGHSHERRDRSPQDQRSRSRSGDRSRAPSYSSGGASSGGSRDHDLDLRYPSKPPERPQQPQPRPTAQRGLTFPQKSRAFYRGGGAVLGGYRGGVGRGDGGGGFGYRGGGGGTSRYEEAYPSRYHAPIQPSVYDPCASCGSTAHEFLNCPQRQAVSAYGAQLYEALPPRPPRRDDRSDNQRRLDDQRFGQPPAGESRRSQHEAETEREREARRKKEKDAERKRRDRDKSRSHRDPSRDSRHSRRDDDDGDGGGGKSRGKGTSGGSLRDAPPVCF